MYIHFSCFILILKLLQNIFIYYSELREKQKHISIFWRKLVFGCILLLGKKIALFGAKT